MSRKKVLVVEDEPDIADLVVNVLTRLNAYDTCRVRRADQALAHLENESVDIIVLDLSLPDMTGTQLYQKIVNRLPALENAFIFMSGYETDQTLDDILERTSNVFIAKPFRLGEFRALIERF